MKTPTPPAVRILPMSTDEFENCSIEELLQNFFLKRLTRRPDGSYWYYKTGLKTPNGSVVLFQYRNFLVASAIFQDSERFDEPDEEGYEGKLFFDTKSIRVFAPVRSDAIRQIWPEFGGFSHVKWSLDPKGYSVFVSNLKHTAAPKDVKAALEETKTPSGRFTAKAYVAALKKVQLAPHQIRMLQINFHAPNKTVTATQMATAMEFAGYQAANLHYGDLASKVGIALGWKPLPGTKLAVLVEFEKKHEWHWTLKPAVASAIEQLGLTGDGLTLLPEELPTTEPLYEGAVKTVSVNAYERNPVAREKCLLHYGSKCTICGVVLADVYGELAQGFVHIHHLKPMAKVTAKYQIDPIKDLRPVCPNCHAIIHLSKTPYSIEEVKTFLAKGKSTSYEP